MRTRLAAFSAMAVFSLASALPAAAAQETLSCTGSIGAFTRSFTFTTDVNMDTATLSSLQGKSVTLRNGLTVTIVSATDTSFTAQARLPFATASVSCQASPTA
jgi:hypothetical protein